MRGLECKLLLIGNNSNATNKPKKQSMTLILMSLLIFPRGSSHTLAGAIIAKDLVRCSTLHNVMIQNKDDQRP